MNDYIDSIKEELTESIKKKKALKEAWEKVTFPTKKDGTQFAIMSRNIQGASYHQNIYVPTVNEYYLTVSTNGTTQYEEDNIYLFCNIEYCTDVQKAKEQNFVEGSYLYPLHSRIKDKYVFDLEDIKVAITERIAKLGEDIVSLEYQLVMTRESYSHFHDAYVKAVEQLS